MKVQNLELQNTERKQAASLFTPENASGRGVLFLHGYQSSREGYAEYAQELGRRHRVESLTIDLPGHGESEGDFTTLTPRDYLNDVVGAYEYLGSRKNVDLGRIGVVGASYGGYLAALLATQKNPKSLLLRAPAIYPDGVIDQARESVDKEAIEEFRKNLTTDTTGNLALDAIRNFDGRVTVVESGKDESIQPCVTETYINVSKDGIFRVLPNARHSLVGHERVVFNEMLVAWAGGL